MKPPSFTYQRAGSIEEATAVLAAHGDDAAVLAGGQSLMIDLRLRRVRPRVVVDIDRAVDRRLRAFDGGGWIGALVRHRELEMGGLAVPGGLPGGPVGGPLGGPGAPLGGPAGPGAPGTRNGGPLAVLLARVGPWVAHPPIRCRGTFGGSVAWGHPCAEWNAVVAGLGGTISLARANGERTVAAADWYLGPCRTARRPDEVVTGVTLPVLPAGTGIGFAEHRRTSASFALVAAVAAVAVGGDGRVTAAHVGVAGAGPVPWRAAGAEALLEGAEPSPDAVEAAAHAAGNQADPLPGDHASVEYRRHVVVELVRRALAQAVAA
ncbi:MAG TPA: FAD binding domain-containing protein [Acidimicrobiales bacterium]|nr:FAD binding domain-containing protein [Acidimicrobiales bacterium]